MQNTKYLRLLIKEANRGNIKTDWLISLDYHFARIATFLEKGTHS